MSSKVYNYLLKKYSEEEWASNEMVFILHKCFQKTEEYWNWYLFNNNWSSNQRYNWLDNVKNEEYVGISYKELFTEWLNERITPEELEHEFNTHEIMELLIEEEY